MNNKLAALDIGTNSFHLIVVSVLPSGNFEIIDREKEVIRLSEGNVGDIKTIQPQSIERAVDAINRFKKISDSHNANMRATATSAVREALNKNEFITTVLERTGVEIEVISGLEEARLIYLGILKAVPIYNAKSLSIDIGGGSTEFIVGESGKIIYSNSLKLGAVRLTQRFFPDYVLTNERIANARKWVEGVISPIVSSIKKQSIELFVGSSGTIMNIGMMLQAAKGEGNKENPILNNFEFTTDDLFEIENKILRKKTAETRKTIPGLEEKRIDIIPAGVIIISTIFRLLNIEKMIISDYALREGIILDSMDKFGIGGDGTKLHNIRFESIKQLAESSRYDSNHCYFVSKLALKLFDQLSELHNLNENAREFLEAASILHDIGYHISHAQHHRHTYYIIRNSAILGFNNTEIEIIANVARYHRKSHPKKSHEGYNTLSESQQLIVKQLSAILRIVDALDRTHNSSVIDFTSIITKNKVAIEVQSKEKMEVELWSLERRKGLFEELFQRKVVVKVQQTSMLIQES